MLKTDLTDRLLARIICTLELSPDFLDSCCFQQEVGSRRGSDFEVEGSVGSNGDSCGYGGTGGEMCCSRIEFLCSLLSVLGH